MELPAPEAIDEPVQLQLQLLPPEAEPELRWWTDNEHIATVSRTGLLTPVNNGVVQVYVQSRVRPELIACASVEVCGQGNWYTLRFLPGTDEQVLRLPEDIAYLKGVHTLKPKGPGYLPVRRGYQFIGWSDITEGENDVVVQQLLMDRDRCVRANWRLAERWDFDTAYDSAGVRLGGFNVRYGKITDASVCGCALIARTWKKAFSFKCKPQKACIRKCSSCLRRRWWTCVWT